MGAIARRLVVALSSAAVLMGFAAMASASEFTIGDREFRATAESLSFEAAGRSVRCAVTLQGSFSSGTFANTSESRVGTVSRASVGTCTGGTVRILTETLPWTMLYTSFAGTLPRITSTTFHLTGAGFQITPTGSPACLARSTERSPIVVIWERETTNGVLTGTRFEETAQIPLSGEGACSTSRGKVSGHTSIAASEGRTELLLLLADEFEVVGVSAEETESRTPVNRLTITAPAVLGTRVIENTMWNYQVRVTLILKIGGNPETFSFKQEAPEDCVVGTVLLPRRVNACNIRVEHPLAPRPRETSIKITYEWGIWLSTFGFAEFAVNAQ
jgi:hypothetical protein